MEGLIGGLSVVLVLGVVATLGILYYDRLGWW